MNQIPRKTLYLLVVFVIVVGLTAFVVWKGFLSDSDSEKLNLEGARVMEISLDLSLLESDKVKELKLFEKLPKLDKDHKRNNPFSSYQTSQTSTTTPE
ncbi:MAG: hypothetical protein V5A57_00520 [Candidatus Paceibacterota bacterium]